MKTVHVPIKEKSYDVHIQKGLLFNVDKFISPKKEIVIITDNNIPKEYINILKDKLNVTFTIVLDAGEGLKCFTQVDSVINELLSKNIPRSVTLVALGGGVIGDLTGFIASIYMRGVDFIQIPTSLLAQVDSSVGGKVGINTNSMKNAVGSFYQPLVVLIDPNTLETLEDRHFNNGMAELIKHGVIAGKTLFKELLDKNPKDNIEELIYQSVTIKRDVVIQDVEDKGIRQLLNFGHTIGHALEQHSKYKLLHGESIAIGMSLMAKGTPYEEDLLTIFRKFNLPTTHDYDIEDLYKYILTDKKVFEGQLNHIVVEEIGNAFVKTMSVENIKGYLR